MDELRGAASQPPALAPADPFEVDVLARVKTIAAAHAQTILAQKDLTAILEGHGGAFSQAVRHTLGDLAGNAQQHGQTVLDAGKAFQLHSEVNSSTPSPEIPNP